MKSIKDYDRMVCMAVKNDPIGFIDILNDEASKSANSDLAPLLREAACVIANLMDQLGIGGTRQCVDTNARSARAINSPQIQTGKMSRAFTAETKKPS